jgi:hypothetical protein
MLIKMNICMCHIQQPINNLNTQEKKLHGVNYIQIAIQVMVIDTISNPTFTFDSNTLYLHECKLVVELYPKPCKL